MNGLVLAAAITASMGQISVHVPYGVNVQVRPHYGGGVYVQTPYGVRVNVPFRRRILPPRPLYYNNGVPHFRSQLHADRYYRYWYPPLRY
jgi:hypothetical protein